MFKDILHRIFIFSAGEISLVEEGVLDYEITSFYRLQIAVYGTKGLSARSTLNITVNDVDEPPVFNISNVNVRIYEEMVSSCIRGLYL